EPGHRGDVVEPVAGRGAVAGRHETFVGVEPDRLHRQAGSPCQFADRELARWGHLRLHESEPRGSSRWRVNNSSRAGAGRTRVTGGGGGPSTVVACTSRDLAS